jgi:hypothetical protein
MPAASSAVNWQFPNSNWVLGIETDAAPRPKSFALEHNPQLLRTLAVNHSGSDSLKNTER